MNQKMNQKFSLKLLKGMGLLIFFLFVPASSVHAEDYPPLGEKINTFKAKVQSLEYLEDRNIATMQFKTKNGTYGVTSTFMTDLDEGASGNYSSIGFAWKSDGTATRYTSRGLWKSLHKKGDANFRWLIKTIGLTEDGSRTYSVGVLKLNSMTLEGTTYALDDSSVDEPSSRPSPLDLPF